MKGNSETPVIQKELENLTKKTLTTLNFLCEPANNENFSVTIEKLNNLNEIELAVEASLLNYPNLKDEVTEILKIEGLIDSISSRVNTMSCSPYMHDKPVKVRLAIKIKSCLENINKFKQFEKQNLQLLKLYLKLIIEYGWREEIADANTLIQKLINTDVFPNFRKTLAIFQGLLKIDNLMIDLGLSYAKYELKCLLQRSRNSKELEEGLSITAFKLLTHAKSKWLCHFEKIGFLLTVGEDPISYSYECCRDIGLLYLSILNETDRTLWDISNYFGIFFDLIHFERKNTSEMKSIIDFYKKSDFKTKQAICHELRNQKLLVSLLSKIDTFTRITQIYHDTTLFYSEIYFTQGQSTQWANSCKAIGYLIIRYDQSWVCLYNTKTGYLTHETGALFDAELLNSTQQNLYFKVLKRDGWHIYKSFGGLDPKNWDSIELLSSVHAQKNSQKYILYKKDKTLYLFKDTGDELIKKFEDAEALKFISHVPTPIFAVKIKTNWQLFDLSADKFIDKFPQGVQSIDFVKKSETFIILNLRNGSSFLYSLIGKIPFPLEKVKKLHFANYDNAFGENEDGSFFTIHASHSHNAKNCLIMAQISKTLFDRLAIYELANTASYAGLQSYGMYLPNSKAARYDFQMELQCRYYITKEEDDSILWLHNTAGGYNGNSILLYQDADNIHFLGVSQTIYNNRKVFFLIEHKNKILLYVSYYSQLKALSDGKAKIETKDIPHKLIELPSMKINFLHDEYFRIYVNDRWQLYEYSFGFHTIQAEEFEALDYRNFLTQAAR